MAVVDEDFLTTQEYTVTRTYDNVSGALSKISWVIRVPGTLGVKIIRTGQANITRTVTTSGSFNVPAGYTLVNRGNFGWVWANGLDYEISWAAG